MPEPIRFGMVAPCPRCHLTGKQAAPAMSKADLTARRLDRLWREAKGQEPLPRPPRTVPCERCNGRGFLPREVADVDTDDPGPVVVSE